MKLLYCQMDKGREGSRNEQKSRGKKSSSCKTKLAEICQWFSFLFCHCSTKTNLPHTPTHTWRAWKTFNPPETKARGETTNISLPCQCSTRQPTGHQNWLASHTLFAENCPPFPSPPRWRGDNHLILADMAQQAPRWPTPLASSHDRPREHTLEASQ